MEDIDEVEDLGTEAKAKTQLVKMYALIGVFDTCMVRASLAVEPS